MKRRENDETVNFDKGFWAEDRMWSGKRIDALRGQNIPFNSRTIDRTLVPRGVVSHKSTDVRCKSYRSAESVYRLGMRFVRELLRYEGEVRQDRKRKATYHLAWAVAGCAPSRVLEWFVPAIGVSPQHKGCLDRVVREARTLGVEVRVFRVEE